MYEDNCLCIIGCGKNKRPVKSKAAELYTGTSFTVRRNWATKNFKNWCILSAKHGILLPGEMIDPYGLTLDDLDEETRNLLFERAAEKIKKEFSECSCFYIVASGTYMKIANYLEPLGEVIFPLEGMQGRSGLHWMITGNRNKADVDKVLEIVISYLTPSKGYQKKQLLSLIQEQLPEYSPTYVKRVLNSSTINSDGEKGLKFRRIFEIHNDLYYLADTYIADNPNKGVKKLF